VWYPRGGFGTIGSALVSLATRAGANVVLGAGVSSLTPREGGKGWRVQEESSSFDVDVDAVIVNGDAAAAATARLFPAGSATERRLSRLPARPHSTACVEVCWGIRLPTSPPGSDQPRWTSPLLHHNVFLADPSGPGGEDRVRAAWTPATDPDGLSDPKSLNFYVAVPSVTDPSAAPEGCLSVMVLVPVAPLDPEVALDTDDDARRRDVELARAARDAALEALRSHGALPMDDACIVHEKVTTPGDWARGLGLGRGAAFGLSHGLDCLGPFRPPCRDPDVQGLFFAGASVRPGNGVPLAALSGRFAAAKAARDLGLGTPPGTGGLLS